MYRFSLIRLFLSVAAILCMVSLTGNTQESDQPNRRWGGWGEGADVARGEFQRRPFKRFHSDATSMGFLVVNGQLFDAPYSIDWDGKTLTCNGELLYAGWPGIRPSELFVNLEMQNLVLCQENRFLTLSSSSEEGITFLKRLSGATVDSQQMDMLANAVAGTFPRLNAEEFIAALQLSPQTRTRVQERLSEIQRTEDANLAAKAAVTRLDRFAYPLTMFGMILTVVAFGHLLSSRPEGSVVGSALNSSPEAIRMVYRSILFVVLLSSLDLIWTIMAWQAGQMKELNPLASQFISDPNQLIAFKGIATFTGTGMLLALKQYRPAQTASWWMCLVCTVLTFRWLTFNSMMIG